MDRDYTDYLKDILDAVDKVQLFIEGMAFEDFIHDDKTIFAVIRAMEIIGEAAKHISDDIRFQHPQVPWKSMAGMRDVLAHDYFGVNLETIWVTAKDKIPQLKPFLQNIIED